MLCYQGLGDVVEIMTHPHKMFKWLCFTSYCIHHTWDNGPRLHVQEGSSIKCRVDWYRFPLFTSCKPTRLNRATLAPTMHYKINVSRHTGVYVVTAIFIDINVPLYVAGVFHWHQAGRTDYYYTWPLTIQCIVWMLRLYMNNRQEMKVVYPWP